MAHDVSVEGREGRATPNCGAVAQYGTVSSVDEQKPFTIKRPRYRPCQTAHHLTQWLCQKGWSAAVAYLLAKVLLILVTTLSH